MKRALLGVLVGLVVMGAAGSGWYLYQEHQRKAENDECLEARNPDACFRLAVAAYRRGDMTVSDEMARLHCKLRDGDEDEAAIGLCRLVTIKRVESSAALK